VERLTPRDQSLGKGALPRTTDHARMLLRRAQIALAAVAVVIAVAVGIAAGASVPSGQPLTTGVLTAGATLLICATVLAVAGAVWRSRLAARDSRDWDRDWARVEPRWSGNQD
jgi:hypothetical protein